MTSSGLFFLIVVIAVFIGFAAVLAYYAHFHPGVARKPAAANAHALGHAAHAD